MEDAKYFYITKQQLHDFLRKSGGTEGMLGRIPARSLIGALPESPGESENRRVSIEMEDFDKPAFSIRAGGLLSSCGMTKGLSVLSLREHPTGVTNLFGNLRAE